MVFQMFHDFKMANNHNEIRYEGDDESVYYGKYHTECSLKRRYKIESSKTRDFYIILINIVATVLIFSNLENLQ